MLSAYFSEACLKEQSIAIIGPSGVGKSTIGPLLAAQFGWSCIDLDQQISSVAGMSIPDIFAQEGEAGFRERESLELARALDGPPAVIACGAGVVMRTQNRLRLREAAWCVYLAAQVEYLLERIHHDSATIRPLLAQGHERQLRLLVNERRPLYAGLAQWTIHVDHLSPALVVEEIMNGWRYAHQDREYLVSVQGGTYQVKMDSLETLAEELKRLGLHGSCWIIADSNVGRLYGPTVQTLLEAAGYTCALYTVAAGEQSKSIESAHMLYSWLLEQRLERSDVVIALGGGVVGDLAGFVAATALRGVAYVQVPTTILAMIDSSIGGKTGINHVRGKNLIGAFHQPRLVLSDVRVLSTLPRRERIAGWSEAIKHGVIADAELFADLERHGSRLIDLPAETESLLARAAAVKIGIVNRDVHEQGERMLLNYGHTFGQALEAATNYTRYLHGEAVAIGMMFAAELAVRQGLFAHSALERQAALLQALELPTTIPAELDKHAVVQALQLDKKRAAGAMRWILPTRIGSAEIIKTVPLAAVVELLDHWLERARGATE